MLLCLSVVLLLPCLSQHLLKDCSYMYICMAHIVTQQALPRLLMYGSSARLVSSNVAIHFRLQMWICTSMNTCTYNSDSIHFAMKT